MKPDEIETMRKNINFITKKLIRKEVIQLLMFFFEMQETPEIITLNRKEMEINGFLLLKKKLFKFEIAFIPENYKAEIILILQFGKTKIENAEKIEISENDDSIDVYLAENKQYLFSIYF